MISPPPSRHEASALNHTYDSRVKAQTEEPATTHVVYSSLQLKVPDIEALQSSIVRFCGP